MGNFTVILINSAAIFQKLSSSIFSVCGVGVRNCITRSRGSLTSHAGPSLRNAVIPYQFKSNSHQARP
jgi:hypothetical protein